MATTTSPTPTEGHQDAADLATSLLAELQPEVLDTTCLRERLIAALNAMLNHVQRRDLDARVTENGVSLLLEHDNVRCVLVVSPQIPRHTLSPRELQIARLVADGATNRAIARSLEISLWTVSTHMRRIFTKLGVSSRAEMVAQFFGGATPLPCRSRPQGLALEKVGLVDSDLAPRRLGGGAKASS